MSAPLLVRPRTRLSYIALALSFYLSSHPMKLINTMQKLYILKLKFLLHQLIFIVVQKSNIEEAYTITLNMIPKISIIRLNVSGKTTNN